MTFTLWDIILTNSISFILGWLICILCNLDRVLVVHEEEEPEWKPKWPDHG